VKRMPEPSAPAGGVGAEEFGMCLEEVGYMRHPNAAGPQGLIVRIAKLPHREGRE
jgi:hypothetical protein